MPGEAAPAELELKRISGGMLVQEADRHELGEAELKVATERAPTDAELRALLFGMESCEACEIERDCFRARGANGRRGRGTDEPGRFGEDSGDQSSDGGLSLAGSVVASDAFFPFPDGVEEAGKAGATAVIQPGGSVRDQDVIEAANKLGMAMVFTGVRHFRH